MLAPLNYGTDNEMSFISSLEKLCSEATVTDYSLGCTCPFFPHNEGQIS